MKTKDATAQFLKISLYANIIHMKIGRKSPQKFERKKRKIQTHLHFLPVLACPWEHSKSPLQMTTSHCGQVRLFHGVMSRPEVKVLINTISNLKELQSPSPQSSRVSMTLRTVEITETETCHATVRKVGSPLVMTDELIQPFKSAWDLGMF